MHFAIFCMCGGQKLWPRRCGAFDYRPFAQIAVCGMRQLNCGSSSGFRIPLGLLGRMWDKTNRTKQHRWTSETFHLGLLLTFGPTTYTTCHITTDHHWTPSPSEVLMFLCNLDCFSHLLRWGPDLPDFESTFESTFESVTLVGGWWKRATCRVDGSEEQTCLSFGNVWHCWRAFPATTIMERKHIQHVKKSKMAALTFESWQKSTVPYEASMNIRFGESSVYFAYFSFDEEELWWTRSVIDENMCFPLDVWKWYQFDSLCIEQRWPLVFLSMSGTIAFHLDRLPFSMKATHLISLHAMFPSWVVLATWKTLPVLPL